MKSAVLKFYILPDIIMLLFSALAYEEKNYQPGGRKKISMCISKTFIIRPYSLSVVLFDEVAS